MMRRLARVVAGVNAVYLGAVGLLSIASPGTAAVVYQLGSLTATSSALSRIVGGLMVGSALVLAAFAANPEANPWLGVLIAAGAVFNVAADVVACLAGELRWAQVAGSLVFQTALAVVVVAYLRQAWR
jgi:hypothetical protein